jgi:hypothetical protein
MLLLAVLVGLYEKSFGRFIQNSGALSNGTLASGVVHSGAGKAY